MTTPSIVLFGGTSGAGRVTAEALASNDYSVIAVGRSLPERKSDLDRLDFVSADITDSDELETLIQDRIPGPRRLRGAAFFQRYRGEGDAWAGELRTSLNATKEAIELLAPKLSQGRGGSVVVVSSNAAREIATDQPVGYHVAKAGLEQMIRYYAIELGAEGIRINGVAPGPIEPQPIHEDRVPASESDIDNDVDPSGSTDGTAAAFPIGSKTSAADVADVVRFFLGASSSAVTGQILRVDGGESLLSTQSALEKLRLQEE